MCARAKLSLVVAWSARGQHVCVSVEEFTGLRSPHAHVMPHGALRFDWVCAKCIAGFRDKMFVMASTPKRSMSSFRSVFADIPPGTVASVT